MASISGVKTNAIAKIGSTFGTAVSGGAGNKLLATIDPNFNVEEIIPKMIGSGQSMINIASRGNFVPSLKIDMDGRYRDCMAFFLAQFFGTAGAPTEQTGGQADYKHTITHNSSLNAKWLTVAYESSSATVIEYPSCAVTDFTLSVEDAPGLVAFSANLWCNNALITGTTNTNASMASATLVDSEPIGFAFDDTFRINSSSGGSLSGSDQYNITGWSLRLSRPQASKGEIKASTGNGQPVETGMFEGELTIKVKELADHARFTEWAAETAQKCRLDIQGTQIGSGVNKALTIYLPKMLQIAEPKYPLQSEGVNDLTLTYRILEASANPTGMSSTKPYIELINGLSTSLLA